MAIEIKGLSGSVQRARDAIRGVRGHIAGLDEEVRALQQTAVDLHKQVKAVHDDLKFEAETLGNGSGESSDSPSVSKMEPLVDHKLDDPFGLRLRR